MRFYGLVLLFFISAVVVSAQERTDSTGEFGESISTNGAIPVKKLQKKMKNSETLDIKVKGTIKEVCQAKGCWMTLDMGNDELLRVKFKDYGFFVPKNAAGKTAIIQGAAKKEVISIDELKHLAEDAGKSDQEIHAINESREELTFIAEGVVIE